MKKILLTATVLVSMTALTKAQQGRVGINTTTPAATLDVTADKADATRPDALLVPRMSRAELESKNAAYGNGTGATNQNGALVFVNALGGTGTGKTVNVTSTGFYYYDAPNSVWVAVGGGGAATPQRYEGTRGSVTILTTTAAYTATATDFFIITKAGSGLTIDLPNPVGNIGRMIYVANNNTGTGTVNVNSAGSPTLLNGALAQNRAKAYISDGTAWVAISLN
ncbi:hypothetical protein [Chryseobacterium sp. G0201]|uniref:hypothetical protein n=1 Tax=Chryseobacterium sp. G0201 TaxID=2487065 RepID=UPI000F5168BC|nr:hypothetical protein [Chryseobacterium sp. G0201]AZA51858.1 hypothetical protein EG348_01925 [Chryseobacterium sp. G0201]